MLFRRSILAAALAALLSQGQAEAQSCLGINGPAMVFTQEAIAVSSTAIGVTSTIFSNIQAAGKRALFVTFTLETNPIRWRSDGLAPTAAVGNLVNNSATGNVVFTICGETDAKRFLAIRTGSDAAMTAVVYVNAP